MSHRMPKACWLLAGLLALVAAFAAPALAGGWSVPPPGYVDHPLPDCPRSLSRPLAHYRVCEDQMAGFASALAKARAEGRFLLVVFGATWCPQCASLERTLDGGLLETGSTETAQAAPLAARLLRYDVGGSVLVKGRTRAVPSGAAVLDLVLARDPEAEWRGWPFIAVLDPADPSRVYTRNTADLWDPAAARHDPDRLRAVLAGALAHLDTGAARPDEPRRGLASRLYHWLID
ncbi:MAG: thioredoxin family protein [Hyphomicrobiaceae bacterium]